MVPIPTAQKCAFIRQIAQQAINSASTVQATLTAAQSGQFTSNFQRGRLLVSQSGSGQSGTFQIATGGGWNQSTVTELTEELIQLVIFTAGTDGGSVPDGTDATTINNLLNQIILNYTQGNLPQIGIREQMGDFSGLNFPSTSLK